MRETSLFLLLSVFVLGCEGRSIKEDNPVLGPPPPRMSMTDAPTDERTEAGHRFGSEKNVVLPASYGRHQTQLDHDLNGNQVVATINGQPIFADEILSGFGPRLEMIRKQAPPDEFEKIQRSLIRRGLNQPLQFHPKTDRPMLNIVDQAIVLQAAESSLLPEQKEMIEEQLDEAFAAYVEEMQKKMGFATLADLEDKLAAEGATLASLRQEMGRQQLALSFLQEKSKPTKKIGRAELLAYYNDKADDYRLPEKVKWQQIIVYVNGDREAAKAKMRDVWTALKEKTPFEDVAKKYSEGATAAEGGHWDWIERDSLADSEVEDILFGLPTGKVSELIVTDDKIELVKVTERQRAGMTPFEDVQRDIEKTLFKELEHNAVSDFLASLRKQADVSTIFDGKDASDPSIRQVSGKQ